MEEKAARAEAGEEEEEEEGRDILKQYWKGN
jgi:hypothetical protein